jgi:hypothetical protein
MANSYLNKTFGTPTDTKKYTMSVWVKRSSLGVQQSIARSTNGSDDSHVFTFNSDDSLRWDEYGSSASIGVLKTNRKFRDTSAWYHVVLWYDSANSTAGDRMRMWINGVEETSFATDTNPSINAASAFNKASQPINIGRTSYGSGGNYFDGYLSHMAFVDGLNVAHTTFGETDSTSGIWKFKSPSGVTWGTNGFHLKFENSGALGTDSSGNTNTFTVNGNLKQALDTPSNVYVNLNPLGFQDAANSQLSNGNTTFSSATNGDHNLTIGNLAVDTGKWYWEVKLAGTVNDYSYIGIRDIDSNPLKNQYVGTVTGGIALRDDGYLNIDGSFPSQFSGISYTAGDIISVGLDLDNNKIYWYENGTLINSGGTTITNRLYAPCVSMVGNNGISNFNFGNGFFGTTAISSAGSNGNGSLFEYDVPSGYYALNTKNINTYG